MTPERLAEIEARAEAATEGPWKCWNGWPAKPMACERIGPDGGGGLHGVPDIHGCVEDLEFAAHARQDIPDLLAYLRELEEETKRLEAELWEAKRMSERV